VKFAGLANQFASRLRDLAAELAAVTGSAEVCNFVHGRPPRLLPTRRTKQIRSASYRPACRQLSMR
jgi:hypothetical protein